MKKGEIKFTDEQKLKNLLETTSNLFYQHDVDHKLTYLSPQVEEILGYEVNEAKIKWTELTSDHPKNKEGFKNTLKAIETGERQEPYELELIHKSGKKIWVEVREVPLLEDEKTIAVVGTLNDITKRKINYNKLKESEKKHRILFDNIESGIGYYDLKGNVILFNKHAAKQLGGKPKDYIGKNLRDLYSKEMAKKILKRISKAAKSSKSKNYKEELDLPTGKKFFLSTYSCVRDGFKNVTGVQIISADITEIRKAEEKLRESDSIFKSYFNSNPMPTFVWYFTKDKFHLIDLNDTAVKNTQGKARNFLGLTAEEIYPDLPEMNKKLSKCFEQKKVLEFEMRYKTRSSGGNEWVKFKLVPFEQVKILMYTEVITSKKQAEEALIMAKEKAEESDRLKTAFLSNMSHEIRTPMNGILGFTELLENPDLSVKKQKEFIDIIKKSGSRMLDTVNDIIDISKLDSGQVELFMTRFDIKSEIESLYNFFKPEAEKKNLSFHLEFDLPANPVFIETDKGKFISVFSNLIKNAIKFTDEGKIEIFCHKMDDKLHCAITDTGIGIPVESIPVVFERFRQAEVENNEVRQGSGLGLSIAKSYLKLMGGNIDVQSELNKGSKFSFFIPWKEKIPDNPEKVSK